MSSKTTKNRPRLMRCCAPAAKKVREAPLPHKAESHFILAHISQGKAAKWGWFHGENGENRARGSTEFSSPRSWEFWGILSPAGICGSSEELNPDIPPPPLIPDPNFPGYSEATKRKGRIWGFSPPPCSPPVFKGRTVPSLLCLQTDTVGTIFALNWKNPICSFHFPPLAHKISS